MSYCPSQDWDRYAQFMDDCAESEMQFYKTHKSEIIQLCAAQMRQFEHVGGQHVASKIVDNAVLVLKEIADRCGEEW